MIAWPRAAGLSGASSSGPPSAPLSDPLSGGDIATASLRRALRAWKANGVSRAPLSATATATASAGVKVSGDGDMLSPRA